jgi:hypothetical protein
MFNFKLPQFAEAQEIFKSHAKMKFLHQHIKFRFAFFLIWKEAHFLNVAALEQNDAASGIQMENQAQTQRTTLSPFFCDAAPDLEQRVSLLLLGISAKRTENGARK